MSNGSCLIYLHAVSPLHMGCGQADGTIDLPHAREAATGYPFAPGSSIKGVLRDEIGEAPGRPRWFGSKPGAAARSMGNLMFGDGALLFLPVRSFFGTFAWVTSRYLLARHVDRLEAAGLPRLDLPGPVQLGECLLATGSVLRMENRSVYLQDLELGAVADANEPERLAKIADAVAAALFPVEGRPDFPKRVAMVHDAVMGYLCDMALEVSARNRLEDDTKTVVEGGLWYEESLPTESILCAAVAADPMDGNTPQFAMDGFVTAMNGVRHMQMGGKATVGRGIVRVAVASQP